MVQINRGLGAIHRLPNVPLIRCNFPLKGFPISLGREEALLRGSILSKRQTKEQHKMYKIQRLLLMLVLLSISVLAQGQVWEKRYVGRGGGIDSANALATDTSGNVYVTGSSNGGESTKKDIVTLKYAPNGDALWQKRYAGLMGDDAPHALSVDTTGNVYVTGYSMGAGAVYNILTLKYDTLGNLLWVKRYASIGGNSYPYALSIDISGNVYITGYTGGSPNNDTLTLKYSTHGNLLWVKKYAGTGESTDVPHALSLDSSGNVYIAGYTGVSPNFDTLLLKYDANGNMQWVRRYAGKGRDDYANALGVDSAGNAYLAVTSEDGSSHYDILTLKYDTNGNIQWVRRYAGRGQDDYATALGIDPTGNVVVAGYSDDGTQHYNIITLKYDTSGNTKWVSRYGSRNGGDAIPSALALDTAGNVYLTGRASFNLGAGFDALTLKYDTNGGLAWVERYVRHLSGYDAGYAIALAPSGAVYVAGESHTDMLLVKYIH